MSLLKKYDYPGNVRELMNIINSSTIVETGKELMKNSLPNYFLKSTKHTFNGGEGFEMRSIQEMEKEHIRKVLEHTDGNRTRAAEVLGISRVNLIAKIKKYEIS